MPTSIGRSRSVEWPRETMVEFLLTAMRLIRKAMIARDLGERGITRSSSAAQSRVRQTLQPADR